MKAKFFLAVLLVAALGVSYAWDDYDDDWQFGEWSAPENLGPVVNDPNSMDTCVTISRSGLTLIFSSTRDAVIPSDRNLYVCERDNQRDPWGAPQPITALNTGVWESCPAFSPDNRRLYFTATGECGYRDIWVSYRSSRKDNFGWEPPVNLGCEVDGGVNFEYNDLMEELFVDETGTVIMYYGRWNFDTSSGDIYASEQMPDGTFGPGAPVEELNTGYHEHSMAVRSDGLEIIFGSNRPGGKGGFDFWTATRESTFHPWSEPVHIPILSTDVFEGGKIAFSYKGNELYFRSNSEGGGDLFVAKRKILHGRKKVPAPQ